MRAIYSEYNDTPPQVGQIVYPVEFIDCNHGGTATLAAFIEPQRTNVYHEPRLTGFLGSYNNVSKYAEGVAQITRVYEPRDSAISEGIAPRVLLRKLKPRSVRALDVREGDLLHLLEDMRLYRVVGTGSEYGSGLPNVVLILQSVATGGDNMHLVTERADRHTIYRPRPLTTER